MVIMLDFTQEHLDIRKTHF